MPDRLTVTDCADVHICARGLRRWFRERGLGTEDFKDFVRNGATMEQIAPHLPDAHIERALARMKERLENE